MDVDAPAGRGWPPPPPALRFLPHARWPGCPSGSARPGQASFTTPPKCVWFASTEREAVEGARRAPLPDVPEVGHRPLRVADVEPRAQPEVLALVVVVARRAVRRTQHPARTRKQELDPGVLGLLGGLDLAEPVGEGAGDGYCDGLARLRAVVRDIGDQVRALDEEGGREAGG